MVSTRSMTTLPSTPKVTGKRKAAPTPAPTSSKVATATKTAKSPKASPAAGSSSIELGDTDDVGRLDQTNVVPLDGPRDATKWGVYATKTFGAYFDCSLVLRKASTNTDKYYIMQLLGEANSPNCILYKHWGRTGSVGQSREDKYDSTEDGVEAFKEMFTQKTGHAWTGSPTPPSQKANKYQALKKVYPTQAERNVQTEAQGGEPIWQYEVSDGVDGKANGFYDYDAAASNTVEGIFQEWLVNSGFSVRSVASGMYTYDVDFNQMKQTNVTHSNHTSRNIRRSFVKQQKDDEDDDEDE